MRAEERYVAGNPRAGESAAELPAADLLSLIDAIEKRLALARQILKSNDRAVQDTNAAAAPPGDQDGGARPARPKRDVVGDAERVPVRDA